MRVNMFLMAGMAAASFLFTGCMSESYMRAEMLTKDGEVKGIKTVRSLGVRTNTQGYKEFYSANNARYRCTLRVRLYGIAKNALENGYPYFALRFPDGSNKEPHVITSTEKALHYCVPGYYDKETDLLDDKCGHIGLGKGAPGGPREVVGIFYKKRNPFVPLWDAKKTMREIEPLLLNECYGGDVKKYNEIVHGKDSFGSVSMD